MLFRSFIKKAPVIFCYSTRAPSFICNAKEKNDSLQKLYPYASPPPVDPGPPWPVPRPPPHHSPPRPTSTATAADLNPPASAAVPLPAHCPRCGARAHRVDPGPPWPVPRPLPHHSPPRPTSTTTVVDLNPPASAAVPLPACCPRFGARAQLLDQINATATVTGDDASARCRTAAARG